MRRADRLFRLVTLLRRRRSGTACWLAEELGVSVRTVYRDVADLVAAGVPIRGEAGFGYSIDPGYELPPLMFTVEEIEALVLGARMVEIWCDRELSGAAGEVLAKVGQALPRRLRERITSTALLVPDVGWSVPGSEQMATLRSAIREHRKVQFRYTDAQGSASQRVVHPLGLFYWGSVTTLVAWCELRGAFRAFRVDRLGDLEVIEECFEARAGQTLHDYLQNFEREAPLKAGN